VLLVGALLLFVRCWLVGSSRCWFFRAISRQKIGCCYVLQELASGLSCDVCVQASKVGLCSVQAAAVVSEKLAKKRMARESAYIYGAAWRWRTWPLTY
jgi:hypothetical protein